jgi:hypothetical protein
MIRQICWKEGHPDGGKTEVRVDFFSGKIEWKFKLPKTSYWNRGLAPTNEQWDTLLDEVERRYQRQRVQWKDVLRVRAEIAKLPRDGAGKP